MPPFCLEELRRHPVQVVTERVVGGQEVPLGAVDQALALLPQPDRLGVHRVATLDVEHVAVAVGAAQLVGVAAGVDVDDLRPVGDLGDREPRGGADLADQAGRLVTLDQLLRLLGGGRRVDAVLGDQLDLTAEHAARLVGLVHGQLVAPMIAYSPIWPRKPVSGVRWPILIGIALRPHDRREAEPARRDEAGGAGRRGRERAPPGDPRAWLI